MIIFVFLLFFIILAVSMATAAILNKSTPKGVERDEPKTIGIGWTNFAAVAMEIKKGGI
jgi:orotate phosphoribosyltransferase-like protein